MGLKTHLQELDQQISELKLDVCKVSSEPLEIDSRPSSGQVRTHSHTHKYTAYPADCLIPSHLFPTPYQVSMSSVMAVLALCPTPAPRFTVSACPPPPIPVSSLPPATLPGLIPSVAPRRLSRHGDGQLTRPPPNPTPHGVLASTWGAAGSALAQQAQSGPDRDQCLQVSFIGVNIMLVYTVHRYAIVSPETTFL